MNNGSNRQSANRRYLTNEELERRRALRRKRRMQKRIFWSVVLGLLVAIIFALVVAIRFFWNVKSSVVMEAGDPVPQADAFMSSPTDSIKCLSDLSALDTAVPADYKVEFSWWFFKTTSTLSVKDTVAPVATAKNVSARMGNQVTANDFIASIDDKTHVDVSFAAAPDMTFVGTQPVSILLKDSGDNQTTLSAELTLYDDDVAPVITGAKNLTVYIGENVSYRKGIEVTDNKDPEPALKIDSTAVNLDVEGTYQITYTATDAAGNSSSVTVDVNVCPRPSNYDDIVKLNQKADELLGKILTPDMNEVQKAFAIFRWCRKNIPWYGGRVKDHDEVVQATKGLNGNSGDCYTCTVTCLKLLERAGFDAQMLERKNNLGLHYWVFVKVNGNWYHMDPSPIYINQFICFLGTDEQVKWFSTQMRPGYYDHDYSKYPATPSDPLATVKYENKDYVLVP